MADYVFKTEPSEYSFAHLQAKGGGVWDGVRNPVALRNMRAMAKGDRVFVYHTGSEKAVVGLARAASAAYPDPKAPSGSTLVVIDLVPVSLLKTAVPLATLKADPEFAESPLVRQGRLSVVPLSARQAARIEKLGEGR
ncbi:MAG: EVE domain-containing protein [Vicinamibacteria bacterium]|nr:EVE domain-containing protein [Vicinamibacteria bacterium]